MSMKAASRVRDSRGFSHSPGSRLTIDPDHHVTEAIGDMYGDVNEPTTKRYSFMPSTPPDDPARNSRRQSTLSVPEVRVGGELSGGGAGRPPQSNGQTTTPSSTSTRSESLGPSHGDPANQQFPLSDIDYESDPIAVAQEISNLQALRRMSMDVTAVADPDLPSFNSFVPSMPPADGGSVFWVPARLHPELAPQEFSAYLEAKKNEIRRPKATRDASLSPELVSSGPSLRRKKSMLSRQIDSEGAKHYRDGADRLEKRNSRIDPSTAIQLEDFMKDPMALMHKLSVDSQRRIEEGDQEDDVPIIFSPRVGLKRSTATHYRKGSLRRGERVGSQKRMAAAKAVDADSEDYNSTDYASIPKGGFKLDRANTEPMPVRNRESSKPARGRRSPDESNPSSSVDDLMPNTTSLYGDKHKSVPNTRTRRGSSPPGMVRPRTIDAAPPVPKIIETPPPPAVEIPERVSSFESPAIIRPESVNRNPTSNASPAKPEHMTVPELKKKRPEVSSGTASSTAKERKTSWGNWFSGDSKEKEKEREREERAKIKKEKDKRPKSTEKLDKHDKTDKTDKTDKHDNTRLDLLQKSIELGHGSKVATVDPIPVVAVEPPKAEVREARKSRVEEKKEKEKDSGFLSFFGGSRKKSSDHTASAAAAEKKGRNSRGTSPDPAAQEKVQPFYYTRFPIHIERAIYRLSHLKLANPRRPLQQQVLLSNFMYSYLAKVQQTQPHLIQQATVSPSQLQKQQAAEMQRQQEQQRWQQRQEEQQQYSDLSNQYYDDGSREQSADYVDESQTYDYGDDDRPRSRGSRDDEQYDDHHHSSEEHHGSEQYRREQEQSNGEGGYYDYNSGAPNRGHQQSKEVSTRDDRDDMW